MVVTNLKVVELFSEDDDVAERRNSDGEDVVRFPLVPAILPEVVEIVKHKLIVSLELQRFRLEREIEFLNKYVDLLDPTNPSQYNNQNDLEQNVIDEMTAEEKTGRLETSRVKLRLLHERLKDVGLRQQKMCDSWSQHVDEIRVLTPETGETSSATFQVTDATWIAALNGNLSLQKIKLICEKTLEVDERFELYFWISELISLIEKLDDEMRSVAFGLILEMACWKGSESDNVFIELTYFLLARDDFKEHIFRCFDRILIFESTQFERYLTSVRVLADVFVKIHAREVRSNDVRIQEDVEFSERFGKTLSDQMVRVLEYEEFSETHWASFSGVFGMVGGHLTDGIERINTLFEAKRVQFEGSTTIASAEATPSAVTSSDSVPFQAPLHSMYSSSSIRNFTVIENPVGEANIDTRKLMEEEIRRTLRKEIEEKMRIEEEEKERRRKEKEEFEKKVREEYEKKEEDRRKEMDTIKKRMEEMEAKSEQKAEELARMKQAEKDRKRQMELDKKKKAEEDRKKQEELERQKKAEEDRKRQEELERRKKAVEEAELARKKKAEEDRKRQEELAKKKKQQEEAELAKKRAADEVKRRQEAVKRANPQTWIPNVNLSLFSEPGKTFNSNNNLAGKVIGYYFSGSWCPPSLDFTPILRDFYGQVEDDFEIVFISWDRSQQEMNAYMQQHHGNWFHLPLGDPVGKAIQDTLNVTSIPTLMILTPGGITIERNGRGQVQNCTNPAALVNHWKAHLNQ